jgi:tetratricopeptide (TPR) repeat protein
VNLDRYAVAVAKMAEEGRFDEALDLAHEAMIRLPPGSPEAAPWHAHIGELYLGKGEPLLAENAFHEALVALARGDRRSPVRGRVLTELSRLFLRQLRFREAEQAAQEALELAECSPAASASTIAFSLRNLAVVHLFEKDYASAEPLLERVMRMCGSALAPDDPELGTALTDLAHVYEQRGRMADAESLRDSARTIVATPYRRLADRVEEILSATGATSEQLAEAVAELRQGSSPPPPLAEAADELAFMLFVRAPEIDANAPQSSEYMVDLARAGRMSWSEILDQLAQTEFAVASVSP